MKLYYKLICLFLLTTHCCFGYTNAYSTHFPSVVNPLPCEQSFDRPPGVVLVLGAGGTRGMAHVGVIEELEKANIPIDLIVGSSAGSIVGALYSHTPSYAFLKKELSELRLTHLYDASIGYSRLLAGYDSGCSGRQLQAFLLKYLGVAHFEDLRIPLMIVATDLLEGTPVIFSQGAVVPCVHASCAYPAVFEPVSIYGKVLIDGGVVNPIPISVAKNLNAKLIIAVDISPDLVPELPTNFLSMLSRCYEILYKEQHTNKARDADILIRPKIGHISSFDDSQSETVYQLGREAAREAIPKIREYIEKMQNE